MHVNLKMYTVLLTQYSYCAGGKIEKNEMGRAYDAYGGGERCAQGFGGEA
jgi:drug/metabolite transporter superfamily protein YnfA